MKWLLLILSFGSGILLEAAAVGQLLLPAPRSDTPALDAVMLHAGSCLCLVPALFTLLPDEYRRQKAITLMLMMGFSITMPVLGPLLLAGFGIVLRLTPRLGSATTEYFFGEDPYLTGTDRSRYQDAKVRSIIELLGNADREVRCKAVLATRHLDLKSAIAILRRAQQDSDEQVRIFARNLLGAIIENLESSLKSLERIELTSEQQVERLVHIAEQFEVFVELGLLSEGSRHTYVTLGIDLLRQLHSQEPENEKILCLLLKLSLLARDLEGARQYLASLRTVSHHADVTIPWELELYFQERDWESLQRRLQDLERDHFTDPEFQRIYHFWRSQSAPQPHG